MAAVDVDSLTITYGHVTAVDDLSFQAEAGEVTCVLGPNGAGKTSTLESLEGLRRPSAGRLRVIGLDPRTDHAALTERIGVMLQEGGIHPAVRVREVLRHAAALYPNALDPGGLIDRLGLAGLERRTYRQLSGGEQQRLALALALVGRPQVAFLDEPTAGVDPAGRQVIRQVIADLRNDGVAVLLTTHDLDEAERVADRVVIVVGGRLVGTGTVEELTRASGGDEQVRFRAPPGVDRDSLVRHLGGTPVVETAPGEYVVAAEPTPRVVAAITAWLAEHDLPLADLRAGRQRLEDVYLRLTGDDAESAAPETAGSRTGSSRRRGRIRTAGRSHQDRDDTDPTAPAGRHRAHPSAAEPARRDRAHPIGAEPAQRDQAPRGRAEPAQRDQAPRGRAEPAGRDRGHHGRIGPGEGERAGRSRAERDQLDVTDDDTATTDAIGSGTDTAAGLRPASPGPWHDADDAVPNARPGPGDLGAAAPGTTSTAGRAHRDEPSAGRHDAPTARPGPGDLGAAAPGTTSTAGRAHRDEPSAGRHDAASDGTSAGRRLAAEPGPGPGRSDDPGDRTGAPSGATDDRTGARSRDDRGLTPSTFEAFWGRGRFRGDADPADDTSWEGWADAPGDPGRSPTPHHPGPTPEPGDPGHTSAQGTPGPTPGPGDTDRTSTQGTPGHTPEPGDPDRTPAPDRADTPRRRGRRRRR